MCQTVNTFPFLCERACCTIHGVVFPRSFSMTKMGKRFLLWNRKCLLSICTCCHYGKAHQNAFPVSMSHLAGQSLWSAREGAFSLSFHREYWAKSAFIHCMEMYCMMGKCSADCCYNSTVHIVRYAAPRVLSSNTSSDNASIHVQ